MEKRVRSIFTAAAFNKPRLEVEVWSRVNIRILLYFIIINATLSKSLSFTASFLIVWNRVYAGCNPYAHTICINNGKKYEKKLKKKNMANLSLWFSSSTTSIIIRHSPHGNETSFSIYKKRVVAHSVSSMSLNFSHSHNNSMVADDSWFKISESCVYQICQEH